MPPLAAKSDRYYFLKQKRMTQRSTAKAWVEHWISHRNAVAHCVCNYSLMRNAPLGPMKARLHNTGKPTVMGSVHWPGLSRQTPISRDISPDFAVWSIYISHQQSAIFAYNQLCWGCRDILVGLQIAVCCSEEGKGKGEGWHRWMRKPARATTGKNHLIFIPHIQLSVLL